MKKVDYAALLWLGPMMLACYFGYVWQDFQLDDALIYLRYIKNFQEGYGLVYNPGERFNGLTSPFFTFVILLTARILLGKQPAVAYRRLLSLFFSDYGILSSQAIYRLALWTVAHNVVDRGVWLFLFHYRYGNPTVFIADCFIAVSIQNQF